MTNESLANMTTRKDAAGFTMMEMLVVLVIIGLIAAVAIPQVMRLLESAKHKSAKIQLETLSHSLNFYQIDMDEYPATQPGLNALWLPVTQNPAWSGPYVRELRQIRDPWGHDFVYRSPGTGRRAFDLICLGADGREGGTGDDADITALP